MVWMENTYKDCNAEKHSNQYQEVWENILNGQINLRFHWLGEHNNRRDAFNHGKKLDTKFQEHTKKIFL